MLEQIGQVEDGDDLAVSRGPHVVAQARLEDRDVHVFHGFIMTTNGHLSTATVGVDR